MYFLSTEVYSLAIIICIALCLLISTFSYARIYRIVRHHQLQIQAQQQAAESLNTEHNLNMVRSKESAISTFIYYMCMIMCYFPQFFYSLVLFVFHKDWIAAWVLADTLVFLNSSINSLLYCWRLRELRAAVVKTLHKIFCKQTEEM